MHIEAELDAVHGERLRVLQDRLQRPLEEVLGVAIDAAFRHLDAGSGAGDRPASLFQPLEAIGFVGCIDDDEQLSADYKSQIDFFAKTGSAEN
jgi:hypothetical protein